jgi:nitrogen fixation protein FixH
VRVAVARKVGSRCRFLRANGRFTRPRSCRRVPYLTARGRTHWRFTLRTRLRPGTYITWSRGVDGRGNVERKHRRRNLRRFRIR